MISTTQIKVLGKWDLRCPRNGLCCISAGKPNCSRYTVHCDQWWSCYLVFVLWVQAVDLLEIVAIKNLLDWNFDGIAISHSDMLLEEL